MRIENILRYFRPLHMKYILTLIILLNLYSCGLLYESNTPIAYKSQSFEAMKSPEAPDYTSLNSWAVHPNNKLDVLASFESEDPKLAVDVFFIYPTLHSNKEESSWNADIYNTNTRNLVLESSVQYQSSAWYSVGNLYAPYYRQAHLRIFKPEFWKDGGEKAYELAYEDLRQAFLMFLEKFNNDRPIIIAGHSQGAGHAKRLLKEFFDGKPLQKKLIAAYLIGTKIMEDEFKNIKHMTNESETGGFVTWNSYRLMSESKERKAIYTISKEWIKGAACSNPITWDQQKTTQYSDHKGFLYLNNKVFPQTVKIESIDDKLLIKTPKVGLFKKILISTIKDYHKADVNLFWEDIRINTRIRTESYLKMID